MTDSANYRDITIERYGAASNLALRQRKGTAPKENEVAVAVKYSGVNFADIQLWLGPSLADTPRG